MKLAGFVSTFLWITSAALAPAAEAQEASAVREAAIITTMSEASLATASLIQDRAGSLSELIWTASYSERAWVFHGKGAAGSQPFDVTITGYLWGEEKSNWTAAFSGSGRFGEEEVLIHGRAEWIFDPKSSDYGEMDFQQVVKFGSNSVWGWVLGAEVIIGGGIGATGGLVAGPAGSIGGAIIVGSAAVGLSVGAKELLESEPAILPEAPPRPNRPADGETINPDESTIITAVFPNGEIRGIGLGGITLSGYYNSSDRRVDGKIGR